MTIEELGKKLKEMYDNAPQGDSYAMVYLFGIKYANEIITGKHSKKEIAKTAGISENYGTEINKAIKLSKYVTIK